MKRLIAVAVALVLLLAMAVPVLAAKTNVVSPEFDDHGIVGAVAELSTEETVLGIHSVKMSIPDGGIGDQYNLGIDTNVRLATGMSRRQGLALYDNISFKAKLGTEFHGWLYNGLILYNRTNELWVSLMPDGTTLGDPDDEGWRMMTPGTPGTLLDGEVAWSGYSFDSAPWPPEELGIWPPPGQPGWNDPWPVEQNGVRYYPWSGPVMSLSNWDEYIEANNLDVKVRKVQIKFGFNPYGWGTVYVDGLSFADRTLDFEP